MKRGGCRKVDQCMIRTGQFRRAPTRPRQHVTHCASRGWPYRRRPWRSMQVAMRSGRPPAEASRSTPWHCSRSVPLRRWYLRGTMATPSSTVPAGSAHAARARPRRGWCPTTTTTPAGHEPPVRSQTSLPRQPHNSRPGRRRRPKGKRSTNRHEQIEVTVQ
jgi:hypothetical protein